MAVDVRGQGKQESRLKRDMDLIRDLLLKIEAAPQKPSWKALTPKGDDAESERILDHLKLIEEAGLTKSVIVSLQGFRLPNEIELTWSGHDFLDAVRDPEIWRKTKEGAELAKSFTFDLLKDLAKGLIKKKIEAHTGVDLDL